MDNGKLRNLDVMDRDPATLFHVHH